MTTHGTLLSLAWSGLLAVLQVYHMCASLSLHDITLRVLTKTLQINLKKACHGCLDTACLPSFTDKILRRKNHGVSLHIHSHIDNVNIGPSQGDVWTVQWDMRYQGRAGPRTCLQYLWNYYGDQFGKLLLCQQSITAIVHHNSITLAWSALVWSGAGQHNVEQVWIPHQ